MIYDPLGRENYVRLICNGYLVLGQPIPEEFWDEWEEILAKDAVAAALAPRTVEEQLLDIAPEPLEVWAVMVGGGTFRLLQTKPSTGSHVTLEAMSPMTGMVDYCRLMRPNGEVLAQFPLDNGQMALVAGDHLHVTLNAEQMLALLRNP